MGPIEEALRENIFPSLFGGKKIDTDFRKILGHRVKHGGLGIPDQQLSAESAYKTSKADSREVVDSILGGSVLNSVGHRVCICKAGRGDVLRHQPISEAKIIPEFLPGQLRAVKAMGYSANPCPIPHCPVEAVFILATRKLLLSGQLCHLNMLPLSPCR